jgi:hypothetical protein
MEIIICCCNGIIKKISNKIIFAPIKMHVLEFQKEHHSYLSAFNTMHDKFIMNTVLTRDGIKLDCCLFNSYKCPSYDDVIILYNHGNRGCIESVSQTSTIKFLSKYGSIFIYDYRGYGKSEGNPSDDGCFEDVVSVWYHLINIMKINPMNIIIFGNSMGTSVACKLMEHLVMNNNQHPKYIILQNGFFSIRKIATDRFPLIGKFVSSQFMTNEFINNIDIKTNSVEFIFFHAIDDNMINYDHSIRLSNIIQNCKKHVFILNGVHDYIYYDDNIHAKMGEIISNIMRSMHVNYVQYDRLFSNMCEYIDKIQYSKNN